MSYPTDRIILFDRDMEPLGELPPDEVRERRRHEEVNGEHELTVVTTRRLEEGWRALTVDGTGKWYEWVVVETPEEHSDGCGTFGTYRLVWSLQYDLTNSYSHTHAEIGYGAMPKTSQQAAAAILQGVARWEVGPCDGASIAEGGCVFIYESAWSRLSKAVELTGWEVDAVIQVSNVFDVTARQLCLKAHVGSEEATRRFDWGHDVTSIKRTPDPGPYYCRVVPLGKGETEYAEDDETTFEWPLDITEEEPEGNYYIEDAEAALAFRISDGEGGWIYPTKAVSYSEDDPELLYNAALDELHTHTRPNVTYEADVVQFAKAGMDARGVSLGDEVQIVDRGFNPGSALRLQGRVISMDVDELSPETGTELTIGNLRDDIASVLARYSDYVDTSLDDLVSKNSAIRDTLAEMTTSRYIDELLDRINTEINATGGYAYFVPGEGVITYDRAVSDPLVGSEASQVVQVKGGSIRIANTKESGFAGIDDWDWKTVFTSGHILSDLVTAVKVTSGYIGNATNSNYWNLDTGELVLWMLFNWATGQYDGNSALCTKNGYVTTANSVYYYRLTGGNSGGDTRYVPGFKVSRQEKNSQGVWSEQSYVSIVPLGSPYSTSGAFHWNSITSKDSLAIIGAAEESAGGSAIRLLPNKICLIPSNETWSYTGGGTVWLMPSSCEFYGMSYSSQNGFSTNNDVAFTFNGPAEFNDDLDCYDVNSSHYVNAMSVYASYGLYSGSSTSSGSLTVYGNASCDKLVVGERSTAASYQDRLDVHGRAYFRGDLVVSGSKSRTANTTDYGRRMLYAYETPTPEFGDIGSGRTDADGLCYVSIDDVFAETASVSTAYQVFLQKCGQGDIWVEEKAPTHFVVRGTPGLAFDWEMKARQSGYENIRLESDEINSAEGENCQDASDSAFAVTALYNGDLDYDEPYYSDDFVSVMERMFDEELMAS